MGGFYKQCYRKPRGRESHSHYSHNKRKRHLFKQLHTVEFKPSTTHIDSQQVLSFIQTYINTRKPSTNETYNQILQELQESGGVNLSSKHKLTKGETRRIWLNLLQKGELYCDLCGYQITKPSELTYDHIIPQSKGGATNILNASPAHGKCNNLKGCILPSKWEQIGDKILKSYGIPVNYCAVRYKYLRSR